MDGMHEVVYVNDLTTDKVKGEDISGHFVMRVATGIIYHARLRVLVVNKAALPQHIAVHLPTTEERTTDSFGMPIIRNSPPEHLRMLGYGRPERD